MKKALIILVAVMALLCLCSCNVKQEVYTVNENGITYTVDTKSLTVSDGENTYKYTISGSANNYTITLIYPNGGEYTYQKQGNGFYSGLGSIDGSYNTEEFANGLDLCRVLEKEAPAKSFNIGAFGTVFLLAVGIFNTFFPNVSMYFSHGWLFKKAEPTRFALNMCRVSGVLCIILALAFIFV